MTVQQLIDLLERQPDLDAPVVLRGSEGQRGWVPSDVVSEFGWREPGEFLTFIEY